MSTPLSRRILLVACLVGGFAATARGDLLVSSQDTNSIFRFDQNTGAYLGTLIGPSAGLNGPVGMRVGPDGDLYIANQNAGTISKYDFATQQLSTFATAPNGVTFGPADIRFLSNGDLLASNFFGGSVVRFNSSGVYQGDFTTGGGLAQPTFMLFDGNDLLVSSLGTNEVKRYNATTGAFENTLIASGSGGLVFPAGLLKETNGNLLVSSLLGQQILQYDASGNPVGTGLYLQAPANSFPSDLLRLPNGDLLISTTGSQGVLRYDGTNLTTFASAPGLQIAGQMLIVAVPEASSLFLGAVGLAGMAAVRFWRRRGA